MESKPSYSFYCERFGGDKLQYDTWRQRIEVELNHMNIGHVINLSPTEVTPTTNEEVFRAYRLIINHLEWHIMTKFAPRGSTPYDIIKRMDDAYSVQRRDDEFCYEPPILYSHSHHGKVHFTLSNTRGRRNHCTRNGRGGSQKGRGHHKVSKRRRCHYCKKFGHRLAECRSYTEDNEKLHHKSIIKCDMTCTTHHTSSVKEPLEEPTITPNEMKVPKDEIKLRGESMMS